MQLQVLPLQIPSVLTSILVLIFITLLYTMASNIVVFTLFLINGQGVTSSHPFQAYRFLQVPNDIILFEYFGGILLLFLLQTSI